MTRAGEHLVAVRARHARCADLFEDRLELSSHAALAVDDDEVLVARAKLVQFCAQLVDDAARVEVQQRRHAIDVDIPATAVDDLLDLLAERPADHESGSHPTSSRSGKRRTETRSEAHTSELQSRVEL